MEINLTIDPTGHFTESGVSELACLHACGYIPQMAANRTFSHKTMHDALDDQYQHGGGLFPMRVGPEYSQVTPEGVHTHPGDMDQYPLIAIERTPDANDITGAGNLEILYMYNFAIVAIMNEDGLFLTRID